MEYFSQVGASYNIGAVSQIYEKNSQDLLSKKEGYCVENWLSTDDTVLQSEKKSLYLYLKTVIGGTPFNFVRVREKNWYIGIK